jgi:hypothetical protein
MEAMADPAVTPDSRPASDLIPMFDRACEAVAAASLDYGDRQQLRHRTRPSTHGPRATRARW